MTIMTYGKRPPILGNFDIKPEEVFYCLYLPISMAGDYGWTRPAYLKCFDPLFDAVMKDEPERFRDEYVYVTGKRMYAGPGISANRPGWHSDGFMSDDLNYVWADCLPTIFNDGPFQVTPDHRISLKEFEDQADESKNYSFHNNLLLKLDDQVIHRVREAETMMMRTFVKISISKHLYNLKDNSINHDLNYSWKRYDREMIRNSPDAAQSDYVAA